MRHFTAMACFCLISALGLPVVSQDATTARQEPTASIPDQEATGRQNFFAALARLSQFLQQSEGYRLELENVWVARFGDSETTGKNDLTLVVQGPGKIRLEVLSGNAKQPQLVAVANGQQVTHWFLPEGIYSRQPQTDARLQIRGCRLTAETLDMCGADFLLNSQLEEMARNQLIHATDLGTEEGLHRFHLELLNGREIDIWFNADPKRPVPVKLQSQVSVAVSESTRRVVTWDSQFKWNLNPDTDGDSFVLNLPSNAREVRSLSSAIMGQNANALVGQPVPALELTGLDGQAAGWQLVGKPTLLYFWATWAAPSVREIQGVQEFASGLEQVGVNVQAVNVAEPADQVAAFVKELGYRGNLLLDPRGEATGKLSIAELPAVVLVGPDGVIRAVYQKADPSIRPQIKAEIEKMKSGQ